MLRHRGYYQPGVQSPGSQPVMSPGGDLMRIIIADYSFQLCKHGTIHGIIQVLTIDLYPDINNSIVDTLQLLLITIIQTFFSQIK